MGANSVGFGARAGAGLAGSWEGSMGLHRAPDVAGTATEVAPLAFGIKFNQFKEPGER